MATGNLKLETGVLRKGQKVDYTAYSKPTLVRALELMAGPDGTNHWAVMPPRQLLDHMEIQHIQLRLTAAHAKLQALLDDFEKLDARQQKGPKTYEAMHKLGEQMKRAAARHHRLRTRAAKLLGRLDATGGA